MRPISCICVTWVSQPPRPWRRSAAEPVLSNERNEQDHSLSHSLSPHSQSKYQSHDTDPLNSQTSTWHFSHQNKINFICDLLLSKQQTLVRSRNISLQISSLLQKALPTLKSFQSYIWNHEYKIVTEIKPVFLQIITGHHYILCGNIDIDWLIFSLCAFQIWTEVLILEY